MYIVASNIPCSMFLYLCLQEVQGRTGHLLEARDVQGRIHLVHVRHMRPTEQPYSEKWNSIDT